MSDMRMPTAEAALQLLDETVVDNDELARELRVSVHELAELRADPRPAMPGTVATLALPLYSRAASIADPELARQLAHQLLDDAITISILIAIDETAARAGGITEKLRAQLRADLRLRLVGPHLIDRQRPPDPAEGNR